MELVVMSSIGKLVDTARLLDTYKVNSVEMAMLCNTFGYSATEWHLRKYKDLVDAFAPQDFPISYYIQLNNANYKDIDNVFKLMVRYKGVNIINVIATFPEEYAEKVIQDFMYKYKMIVRKPDEMPQAEYDKKVITSFNEVISFSSQVSLLNRQKEGKLNQPHKMIQNIELNPELSSSGANTPAEPVLTPDSKL